MPGVSSGAIPPVRLYRNTVPSVPLYHLAVPYHLCTYTIYRCHNSLVFQHSVPYQVYLAVLEVPYHPTSCNTVTLYYLAVPYQLCNSTVPLTLSCLAALCTIPGVSSGAIPPVHMCHTTLSSTTVPALPCGAILLCTITGVSSE